MTLCMVNGQGGPKKKPNVVWGKNTEKTGENREAQKNPKCHKG